MISTRQVSHGIPRGQRCLFARVQITAAVGHITNASLQFTEHYDRTDSIYTSYIKLETYQLYVVYPFGAV